MNSEQNKQLQEWKLKYIKLNPILLIFMGLILIAFGIVSQTVDINYEYISTRYDEICANKIQCSITIVVPSKMKSPIFFSYEVSSFFQNTDKYFNSIPYDLLYGNLDFDISICDQYKSNREMGKIFSVTNKTLEQDEIAIPCGIAAYSYMNDEFTLTKDGNQILITDKGIAWESDKEKFTNINLDKQWIDMESERFINWMRPSPLSKFRKLWGRIDQDLESGTYTVNIQIKTNDAFAETKKYFLLHNNGQFSDPILVITLPCLCVGPFLIIFGLINMIYWGKKQNLIKKYRIY
ncbi:unnamed protein product [Paramecium sonneborni]|uniref:Cell cycle control protein n=1 Tax=Paramecium sonneborni TaxID=65129 RepID=A0A8S1MG78_9CILI|nr:unnamed protein product [Paramecium sonneborni]